MKAASVHGPDKALVATVVVDRLTRPADRVGERCVADELVRPDGGEDLVAGDDARRMEDQEGQQVEHLGLDRDPLAGAAQLEQRRVDLEVPESADHPCRPPNAR